MTISAGQTTTVNANFIQRGSLRVITSPAVPGTISVGGVPRNNWGLWTDIPVGNYQVCFGAVADFTAPACQNANVQAGQLTTITGTYVTTLEHRVRPARANCGSPPTLRSPPRS